MQKTTSTNTIDKMSGGKHRRRAARVYRYGRRIGLTINGKAVSVGFKYVELSRRTRIISRLVIVVVAAVMFFTVLLPVISEHLAEKNYALTSQESSLLPKSDPILEKNITYDTQSSAYQFKNSAGTPKTGANGSVASSDTTSISATIPKLATSGVTVTDPLNNIDLKITPKFDLAPAQQDTSHVYYPLANGSGKLVYSPQVANLMEDLVLRASSGNTMHFDYTLDTSTGLQARLQHDGSVNVYGSELSTLGNISAGSSKDAALLQKARKNAQKTKLLFSLPAPTIKQNGGVKSPVSARYSLLDSGKTLRITATNLKHAIYPLDIDPTVSVSSISQIFRDTNGESNVDFNTTNGTINRGAVTGGVFDYTTGLAANSTHMLTPRFLGSSVVSNGYIYANGGAGTTSNDLGGMEYALICTGSNSGVGGCSATAGTIGTWISTTSPTAISQYRLLAYNGYLYALGGSQTSTGCSSPTSTILYNTTQPNGALSSTWNSVTSMSASLCSFGAAVYNNTMYVVGGQTGSGTGNGVTTVYYNSILPNGTLGSWSTATSTPLPTSLYADDVQIYNGYIYVIGGSHAGTLQTTIYRAPLNSDGTIFGTSSAAWVSLPNTFGDANGNLGISNLGGGSFTAINDGYMYVSGGCTALNATFSCTAISGNTYLAQINADGTLGPWSQISTAVTDPVVGGSLTSFGGYLYLVGGCKLMNTATISCSSSAGNLLDTQAYAQITDAGQIGPVTNQTNTLIPTHGLYQEAAVVNNGYLYLIGGCLTDDCSTNGATSDTSSAIYYAAINADGSIGAFSTSAFTINNVTKGGLGAIDNAAVVYDNFIYVFGGYNYGGFTNNTTAFTNGVPAAESASNVVWSAPIAATATAHDLTANFTAYTTTKLTTGSYSMAAVADKGFIYAVGGCYAAHNSAGCSTYLTVGYRATVGPTGITALNTTSVAALPTAKVAACNALGSGASGSGKNQTTNDCFPGEAAMGIALYNGYVYLVGGASGSNGESVIIEYGAITATGTITSWTAATTYLPYSSAIGYPAALRRAAAYAYNGYLYVIGGHDGDTGVNLTSPNISIGTIDLSTGNITATSTSSQLLPNKEWDGAVAFADGTVYVAGGCYNGTPPTSCSFTGGTGIYNNRVQTFQLYNADNTGTATWNNSTNTYSAASVNSTGLSAIAYNGYIYEAGGCTTYTLSALGPCSNVTGKSAYAALNPDGSIGTWTAGPTLSNPSAFGCLLANNGYLYYIGGVNASNVPLAVANTVFYSLIGANGVPGAWTAATNKLPAARGHIGCDSFDGTLYVVGGESGSTSTTEGTDQATVYRVQPDASGGDISTNTWTSDTAFTTARRDPSVVAAGGYLYVIGGYSNGGTATYYNDVQYDDITPSTGDLGGTWTATRSLPMPVTQTAAIAANGYIFVFGGSTAATTCQNTTYIASINNTGELSSWTQGISGFTTNAASTQRTGAGAAYYNGYYYVLGGYDCSGSALATSNVIQYGGEQSQSMNSFFTRYADLTGNAYPQKFVAFVTNAQVNSTDIESWKMAYKSSATAANSWGVATTISPVTSGGVNNVFAYDGSGTNVKLEQWAYLAFSISMEKSFTFTDTTQPSVNSYYLYYSPYAGSRLRNGKTFQDEQQQGLDLNLQ